MHVHGSWKASLSARPANVPSNPNQTYKHDGWQGYGHWLGTGNLVGGKQEFLPFKKALLYARSLKLKGKREWQDWSTSTFREANMPSHPNEVYAHDGWLGWGHWLDTGNVATKDHKFLPFKKALLYARSLKLKGVKEWKAWRTSGERPADIPSHPETIYKLDGWLGWGHWLGTGTVADKDQKFMPFKKALLHARSLKLKGEKDWRVWNKSSPSSLKV